MESSRVVGLLLDGRHCQLRESVSRRAGRAGSHTAPPARSTLADVSAALSVLITFWTVSHFGSVARADQTTAGRPAQLNRSRSDAKVW